MKKTRAAVAERRGQPKNASNTSDERLRRLFHQAERTTDARKRAHLKEEFIQEFYQGAR
jgi:hypothetical protein